MRPIIHSQKHYVQTSRATVSANAVVTIVIADSVTTAAKDQVFEVEEGSSIKAVYVEIWALGSGNDTSSIVALYKAPVNDTAFTFTEMAAMGVASNKKNVLFFHQGLAANDGVGQPVPLMRGWYKIPKGKQRMGVSDRIILSVACQTAGADTMDICGFATYKEYT